MVSRNLCVTDRSICCGGLCLSSASMGAKLAGLRTGFDGISMSTLKARSVQARASVLYNADGDLENLVPSKPQGKSSGTVLPFVGVACLGAILFGYHLGVVNGSLEYLSKDLGIAENAVLQGKSTFWSFQHHKIFAGWVVSALLAGATVGSFTGGALADNATSQSVQTMIVGRLLAGIGIGITSSIVPLYISEISPTEIRGALGSVNQLFICIGILGALVAGLPLAANPLWWRTMFGVAIVPSVLLALGMAASPESPRWLFQVVKNVRSNSSTDQGKISEAEKAIKTLYGKERVSEVMHDLTSATQGSVEPEASWFDLFSSRYRKLAGINAVVYYSTSVFRSAGITSDVAASALVGAANVFGTAVASSLMDRQGRKSLLLTSFGGMAASMLLLSLSFTWKVLAPYSGPLAVAGTVLYVLSFSLGAGPVPALLLPEIFASRIRAKQFLCHWACTGFKLRHRPLFLELCNQVRISSVYLGFAGVCLRAVLYVAGNVVETKGRSLEK
ncbi:plastidic GLC translocator [Prunus dulcis]|uniref:Plastidic GLC translocator n=1 Tax=Prunus dulcis TaxID=3755 RepID=A0A4Y1R664_PRUDU|nr:plastidic GLC translocator [Prunus dulcis]